MATLSQEEVNDRIKNLYNGEYEATSPYIASIKPMNLKHKVCGTEYTVGKIKTFLNEGEGLCPTCRLKTPRKAREKVTEANLQEVVNVRLESEEYEYLSGFINMKTKCLFKHTTCGNEFLVDPSALTGKRKQGCPICKNLNRGPRVSDNHLETLLETKDYGDEYTWLDAYTGSNKDKLRIKHSCGNIYSVRPNDFQQGYKCPTCSRLTSDEEESFYKYITDLVPTEKLIRNYRGLKKEIDIYFPDRKIGFEYNGYFWHSDKFRDKKAHINKLNYFKEHGIRVYFIDSWDWLHKPYIVQDRLKSILGLNKTLGARKTICKPVFKDEEQNFLTANHIQGYAISSFALGLYYNDELVSLLSFVKARTNMNQAPTSMELLRSCSKLGINVSGGFSKLQKASDAYIAENYPDIKELRTFADLTLSDGEVYKKNGYKLDHYSQPSYYYIYKKQKRNRYYYRKSALLQMFPEVASPDLTEFQIMDKLGAYRVWNCGNLVFTKKI